MLRFLSPSFMPFTSFRPLLACHPGARDGVEQTVISHRLFLQVEAGTEQTMHAPIVGCCLLLIHLTLAPLPAKGGCAHGSGCFKGLPIVFKMHARLSKQKFNHRLPMIAFMKDWRAARKFWKLARMLKLKAAKANVDSNDLAFSGMLATLR